MLTCLMVIQIITYYYGNGVLGEGRGRDDDDELLLSGGGSRGDVDMLDGDTGNYLLLW